MRPKTVVNCRTEEQAKNLLAWANSKGLGLKYFDNLYYLLNKENTCFDFFRGHYCDKDYYLSEGFTVLPYEYVLVERDIVQETLSCVLEEMRMLRNEIRALKRGQDE